MKLLHELEKYFGPPIDCGKGEYEFFCPNESCSSHEKGKKKLAVNIKNNSYHCWVCGISGKRYKESENPVKVFARLLFKTDKNSEAYSLLRSQDSIHLCNSIEEIKIKLLNEEEKIEEIISIPETYERLYFLKNNRFFKNGYDYLTSRGLVDEDLIRYDIHYSPNEKRVLFPSYDENMNINYYVSRSIFKDAEKPYDNPKKEKNKIIFNEHLIDWNSKLFIVEGIFDSILSRKNSVPILGSSLSYRSDLFNKIHNKNTRIVLSLDPDAKEKSINIAKTFIKYNISIDYIDWGDEELDIAEMGHVKFEEYSNKCKNFNIKSAIIEMLKG